MNFKINSNVIVREQNKIFVGKIINAGVKKNRRAFDILLESGRIMIYVPVDAIDQSTYIDSNLTKKIVRK